MYKLQSSRIRVQTTVNPGLQYLVVVFQVEQVGDQGIGGNFECLHQSSILEKGVGDGRQSVILRQFVDLEHVRTPVV